MAVLIDLEFTGLDNTFTTDNEIVQVKMMNTDTGSKIIQDFNTKKPASVYEIVGRGSIPQRGPFPFFSLEQFDRMLTEIGASRTDMFYGYSVSQDMLMLGKYDINLNISDLQETLRLCPDYELQMATGCNKMELACYLVTGKIPPTNTHYDIKEIYLIAEIYEKCKSLKQNDFYTVMPFGHCAGMPIEDYVENFRRAADGYRFNNSDRLSLSLSNAIDAIENLSPCEEDDEYETFRTYP